MRAAYADGSGQCGQSVPAEVGFGHIRFYSNDDAENVCNIFVGETDFLALFLLTRLLREVCAGVTAMIRRASSAILSIISIIVMLLLLSVVLILRSGMHPQTVKC